ncbi:hypothetical protein [Flindersiella endophytica]
MAFRCTGYLNKTGPLSKRLHRLHFDGQSRWRVATTAQADVIDDEPGWTRDSYWIGYLL